MHPLVVRHEIDGFLADRLSRLCGERSSIWWPMVSPPPGTREAITYGPGLRWSGMGTNLTTTWRAARKGWRHMLDQFGPALEWPWTKLVAPPLTDGARPDGWSRARMQPSGRAIRL